MANSQFAIAIHILTMLADNCDERVKSSSLAKSVNTNAVVIRRLLCDLHDAGLVVSRTGYSGGSCLTRDAGDINLKDVFEAVSHGQVFALHRQKPDKDCRVGKNIGEVLTEIQTEVDSAVLEKLGRYTLADVIDKVRCGKAVAAKEVKQEQSLQGE